jgi:hypothetical protein
MPHRNRVTPDGELIAVPDRGLFFGNRGCLHSPDGRIVRHAQGIRWIICELAFKGRRRHPLMQPGRYTELFFLDEATALAAGHRPCAECRRERFNAFRGDRFPSAVGLDTTLDAERRQPTSVDPRSLPPGAMFKDGAHCFLVTAEGCRRWSPGGYGPSQPLPRDRVTLLTPPATVDAIRAGYAPVVYE